MGISDLPRASGLEHVRVFRKFGWIVRREGNHIILTHPEKPRVTLSIPNHREVKLPLLKRQIQIAGLDDKLYRAVFDSL